MICMAYLVVHGVSAAFALLAFGAVLEARHLQLAEADITREPAGADRRPESLVGRTLMRAVAPGQPLRADMARPTWVLQPGDPVVLVSRSGTTAELIRLLPTLRSFKSPLIAIVGNVQSPLAAQADVVLDIGARPEADPLGLVPTTSALLTLALGDALAAALMTKRGFAAADFARFHPAGQLGRNLLLTVGEALQPLERCAVVAAGT